MSKSVVEVKLHQDVQEGHWQVPARKRKYRNIDARIQSLKDELINNAISDMLYTYHIYVNCCISTELKQKKLCMERDKSPGLFF